MLIAEPTQEEMLRGVGAMQAGSKEPGIRHTFVKFLAARQLLQFASLFTSLLVFVRLCLASTSLDLMLWRCPGPSGGTELAPIQPLGALGGGNGSVPSP